MPNSTPKTTSKPTAPADPNSLNSAQNISMQVALDAEGNLILPSELRRTLRSYAHAHVSLVLKPQALRAAGVEGQEIQGIVDTQKVGLDVVVYALGGEGMAADDPDLAAALRSLL